MISSIASPSGLSACDPARSGPARLERFPARKQCPERGPRGPRPEPNNGKISPRHLSFPGSSVGCPCETCVGWWPTRAMRVSARRVHATARLPRAAEERARPRFPRRNRASPGEGRTGAPRAGALESVDFGDRSCYTRASRRRRRRARPPPDKGGLRATASRAAGRRRPSCASPAGRAGSRAGPPCRRGRLATCSGKLGEHPVHDGRRAPPRRAPGAGPGRRRSVRRLAAALEHYRQHLLGGGGADRPAVEQGGQLAELGAAEGQLAEVTVLALAQQLVHDEGRHRFGLRDAPRGRARRSREGPARAPGCAPPGRPGRVS